MSQELFESIVDQIVEAGGKGVVVFLSNYNEPTIDPLFEERCRALFARGLPVSILTNASHFDSRAGRAPRAGRAASATSASTCRRSTRSATRSSTARGTSRGCSPTSTRCAARALAEETAIVVLGDEDEAHRRDVEAIRERFEPKGWEVKPFKIRSRPASGTFVPEPPAEEAPARLRADGLAALRAPARDRDGEGGALLPGLLRAADGGGPEDPDGGGAPGRRRRWRGCAAGPTASRRRPTTSSAAAASSRIGRVSESPMSELAVRADRVSKTYRALRLALRPAARASPAPAAPPRVSGPLGRLVRARRAGRRSA